jgi:antirestriction protein ArdC
MTFGKPPAQIDKAERAVGKQAVLGAGYGMGAAKFAATCAATRLPWSKPWCALENTGLPTNVVSERCYSGVNVLLLQLVGQARGYQSKFWGTFHQWQSLGCHVMKRPDHIPAGQYGTRIIFCKPVTKTRKDANGDDEEERFFLLREFVVFNAEQVTGPVEAYLACPRPGGGFVDYQPAEDVIAATGADLRHGGGKAVYRIEEDYIQLPPKEAFSQAHEYYCTALHELTHWTGHENRLARLTKLARFGSEAYAVEELVAEMGSAFLLAELGIPQSDDLKLVVSVVHTTNNFSACYGSGRLDFNLLRLGHRWFEQGASEDVDSLLIHEFGHEYSDDHLSSDYHEALCRLGAGLKKLALERPEAMRDFLR